MRKRGWVLWNWYCWTDTFSTIWTSLSQSLTKETSLALSFSPCSCLHIAIKALERCSIILISKTSRYLWIRTLLLLGSRTIVALAWSIESVVSATRKKWICTCIILRSWAINAFILETRIGATNRIINVCTTLRYQWRTVYACLTHVVELEMYALRIKTTFVHFWYAAIDRNAQYIA